MAILISRRNKFDSQSCAYTSKKIYYNLFSCLLSRFHLSRNHPISREMILSRRIEQLQNIFGDSTKFALFFRGCRAQDWPYFLLLYTGHLFTREGRKGSGPILFCLFSVQGWSTMSSLILRLTLGIKFDPVGSNDHQYFMENAWYWLIGKVKGWVFVILPST